jgi:hypothetical protein
MSDERSKRIQGEIAELWSAAFGEQPAICADPDTMIRILVDCLEDVGPWELSKAPRSN